MDANRPVSEIMRTDFLTLKADDRLDFADAAMRLGRIRHLPVLEEGRLVGVVSQRDILAGSLSRVLDLGRKQRETFMHSVDISELVSRKVVTARPETSLRDAARLMIGRKIGCLPVVNEAGVAIGLVTETDLLAAAYTSGNARAAQVHGN